MIIKPILRVLIVFLVVPLDGKSTLYITYVITLIFVYLISIFFCYYGKLSRVLYEHWWLNVLDQFTCFFLYLTVLTNSISTIFFHPKYVKKIVDNLSHFDDKFSLKSMRITWEKKYFKCFLLVIILNVINVIYNVVTNDLAFIKYEFIKYLSRFQLNTCLYLYFWLNLEIYQRFKRLNDILSTITIKISNTTDDNNVKTIDKVRKYHHFLCNTADLINELYGVTLLLNTMYIIGSIVYNTSILIYHCIVNTISSDLDVNLQLIGSVFGIVMDFAVTLTVAAAGRRLSTEARNTVQICYDVINDGNHHAYENYETDLTFLAQQVVHRDVELSAAGFFSVNFTMIGFMVSSITSYIIVALEFMNDSYTGIKSNSTGTNNNTN